MNYINPFYGSKLVFECLGYDCNICPLDGNPDPDAQYSFCGYMSNILRGRLSRYEYELY